MNAKLNNSVTVAGVQTIVTEYNSVPVMTTEQMASFYGTEAINIQKNYSRNSERFEEGKHFFKVEGDDLRSLKKSLTDFQVVSPNTRSLMLWTEKGAARHAKILDTDQAWNVFEQLEDSYFKAKELIQNFDPMKSLADPRVLRDLLLGYSERIVGLEEEVQEMKPSVEAYDRIAKADGSLCLTDAAKALQMRPKDLIAKLSSGKWIYKRAGNSHWLGYQDKVQAGYLEHKITEVTRGDGTTKITEQVRITPKGLAKLAKDQGGTA
ncbi:phage antirepressor KilAC domain-containing protein [Acinetobacter lwoffii]|uniref:phage antirepressor KilAC domain-containing protein n=1 Tax=Acinetobacter lwoffii TaxID=28090 RepID=UPI0002D0B6AF|nr:phage antirepressor KilAC domain-containing protein [Acinetobacter lwoffii]ENU62483.1 hypothetical protein F980_01809 [Acinetobacter lwoffii NIPH 715]